MIIKLNNKQWDLSNDDIINLIAYKKPNKVLENIPLYQRDTYSDMQNIRLNNIKTEITDEYYKTLAIDYFKSEGENYTE